MKRFERRHVFRSRAVVSTRSICSMFRISLESLFHVRVCVVCVECRPLVNGQKRKA